MKRSVLVLMATLLLFGCGKPATCLPDYAKHQFVLERRGTARVNDD